MAWWLSKKVPEATIRADFGGAREAVARLLQQV